MCGQQNATTNFLMKTCQSQCENYHVDRCGVRCFLRQLQFLVQPTKPTNKKTTIASINSRSCHISTVLINSYIHVSPGLNLVSSYFICRMRTSHSLLLTLVTVSQILQTFTQESKCHFLFISQKYLFECIFLSETTTDF